jgi:phospholipase C
MSDPAEPSSAITRRRALRDLGLAGLGATTLGGLQGLLEEAAAASPKTGSLKDIDHVVIFIQENRSFDHYFGTLSGVRGFGDKHAHKAFFQRTSAGKKLHPFRLTHDCLPDITHDWAPQHQSWNGGRMDGFITSREPIDGASIAPETIGYYKRSDLPFYYALADAFTICDGYYCSVLGPTDPNRLMSMSATIDPAGTHGGPLLQTLLSNRTGRFSWPTMPESLERHGVSWKVYTSPGGGSLDGVLTYFKAYAPGTKLASRGLSATFPADFLADLGAGKLPQVSWILAGVFDSEHPANSTPKAGEIVVRQVVEALVSHPKTWRKTALFLTWDENGGFFDHMTPPTPPPGTPGEYLTVATLPAGANGIRGPIGLGFRVPMLVVSPFSRGGLVCSDTFDHTSTLRFLETRFRVRVPNLSNWRRKHTGDLTSAFNFAARPRYGRPSLKALPAMAPSCLGGTPVPVTQGPFPRQERGKRRRPSGPVH